MRKVNNKTIVLLAVVAVLLIAGFAVGRNLVREKHFRIDPQKPLHRLWGLATAQCLKKYTSDQSTA